MTYIIGSSYKIFERVLFNSQVSGIHIVNVESKPIANKEPSMEKVASVAAKLRYLPTL